jgi:O-antigen/teichoic acid export membrane protein
MGGLSSFALSIVSAAILSRYLDKADYGTYRQILYVYNTLLVIFVAGLPNVFSYFLPRYSIAQGKDVVKKITRMLFLAGMLFSVFLFTFSGIIASLLKNPELTLGLKYFSPIPMLLLPTLGIEGIFATYKKTIYIAMYNTLTRLLLLLFMVLPVILLKGSYLDAMRGWLVGSCISFLLAYYFIRLPFKGITAEKSYLSYREVFAYSLPLVVASIAGTAIRTADQFYISRFFGAEVFAEFSNGFIELPFVAMVTGATSAVLQPMFSKIIYDKSDISILINLWKNALLKSAVIIYPLVVFFIFNAYNVVVLLYSKTYANSSIYFQIAMAANFFNIIVFAPLVMAMGKTTFYAQVHMVLALCAWIIGYIIIQLFNSPYAIAIFSVSLRIITIMIFLKFAAKLIEVNLFNLFPVGKLSIVFLHSGLVLAIVSVCTNQLLPQLAVFPKLSLQFSGFVIVLLATSSLFKLDYTAAFQPIKDMFLFSRSRIASVKGTEPAQEKGWGDGNQK